MARKRRYRAGVWRPNRLLPVKDTLWRRGVRLFGLHTLEAQLNIAADVYHSGWAGSSALMRAGLVAAVGAIAVKVLNG